jgi:hypothetical protein
MALSLLLAASTLVLGFAPTIWLWRGRGASTRDWLLRALTAGGLVTFAYGSAPWLLLSHYLRYAALAAFAAVGLTSVSLRRTLIVPPPAPEGRGVYFTLRAALLVAIAALNALALKARVPVQGAVDLAFPLSSGTYTVLQGGNSIVTNPFHRANAGERFALDLVKLNAFGARARGPAPRVLAAYAVFNDPLFSPCDGTVVEAIDGVADNSPGRANVAAPAGNHIVLRCQGVELLLAHLRQGSVAVRSNERVARGRSVGRVGNSGNTSEPHLHISASRGGVGVPLTFEGRVLTVNSVWRGNP